VLRAKSAPGASLDVAPVGLFRSPKFTTEEPPRILLASPPAFPLECPRVAAFPARYLYSHQVQDRLLPLE
jgi:hypothetical protein